jgi:hypothetical protein
MTEASRGLGGEGLSLLQVWCDSAPVRPAAPGSRGELPEGAGDRRQVPDQCQDVLVSSGHRQGSRGGQRRCCRFNWRIARRLHDISPSIVQLRPSTTTELASRLPDTTMAIDLSTNPSSVVRGTIKDYRHRSNSAASGDGSPRFLFVPSTTFSTVQWLVVEDIDLTGMMFSASTGNTNYRPLGIDSTNAANVYIRQGAPFERYHRRLRVQTPSQGHHHGRFKIESRVLGTER